jgi:hypothetical protein
MVDKFTRSALILLVITFAAVASTASGQSTPSPGPAPKATPAPIKLSLKPATAEELVETAIFYYAYPGGRFTLNQIRKTTQEHGRVSVTNAAGRVEQASYQKFVIRADSLDKEKIRIDQILPNARFSLIYTDDKTVGVFNNTVFQPRDDVRKSFENQIFHGVEALLRYKENGSTLELQPREKLLGVDYYVVDVTDKQSRKTRFFISAKSFRVMMLEYEDEGVKYRRKFYDYNYAQGTLVPSHSILWADGKVAEDSEVLSVTFGQKVDEELFKVS